MRQHFYFIINQNSRNYKDSLEVLNQMLPKYTQSFDLFPTRSTDQACHLLKKLKPKLQEDDVLIAVGGDGSLHTLINQVKQLGITNPLSFLPGGSGNDFARSNDIPLDLRLAVTHFFKEAKSQVIDILRMQTAEEIFYAVNSIGYGLDGNIIYAVSKSKNKKRSGAKAYVRSILSAFLKLKPFRVQIKTDQMKEPVQTDLQLLLMLNQPFLGGGINAFPTADNQDGQIDILLARQVTWRHFIPIIWRVLTQRPFLSHPRLKTLSAQTIELTVMDPQYAQRDGESFRKYNEPLTIDLVEHPFII